MLKELFEGKPEKFDELIELAFSYRDAIHDTDKESINDNIIGIIKDIINGYDGKIKMEIIPDVDAFTCSLSHISTEFEYAKFKNHDLTRFENSKDYALFEHILNRIDNDHVKNQHAYLPYTCVCVSKVICDIYYTLCTSSSKYTFF